MIRSNAPSGVCLCSRCLCLVSTFPELDRKKKEKATKKGMEETRYMKFESQSILINHSTRANSSSTIRRTRSLHIHLPLPPRNDRVSERPPRESRSMGRNRSQHVSPRADHHRRSMGSRLGQVRSQTHYFARVDEHNGYECAVGVQHFHHYGYHCAGVCRGWEWECWYHVSVLISWITVDSCCC